MSQSGGPTDFGRFEEIGTRQPPSGPAGAGQPPTSAGAPTTGEPPPEVLQAMLETFRRSGASIVFGEPRPVDGATLIPVASNVVGFGFGQGRGPAQTGGGGGGGGFARTRPLGFIVVQGNQIRFCPTFDVSRIALTGLIVSGLLAALWVVFRR